MNECRRAPFTSQSLHHQQYQGHVPCSHFKTFVPSGWRADHPASPQRRDVDWLQPAISTEVLGSRLNTLVLSCVALYWDVRCCDILCSHPYTLLL